MNQTPQKPETPPLSVCPIPRRGLSGVPGLLLALLLTVSSLLLPVGVTVMLGTSFLPLAAAEGVSLVYLVLIAFYFNRTAKLAGRVSRGFTPLLILTALLTYGLFKSLVPAAILISLVFVIGEGGVVVATAKPRSGWMLLGIPFLSLAAAVLLCNRIDVAALALLPYPASIALGFGTGSSAGKETGLTRVGVICAVSFVFGLTLLGFSAWYAYNAFGSLEIAVLLEKLEAFREEMKQELLNYSISYGDTVVLTFTDKEEIIKNAVNSAINTLPGTLVVTVNIFSAVAQMITLSGLHAYGFGDSVTGRVRDFHISPVSAIVFLVSWIVALLAVGDNNASTMVGTMAENLYIILIPGLALAGVFRIMRGIAAKGPGVGCGWFLFILIPCLALYIPPVIALYEAMALLLNPWLMKRYKKKNEATQSRSESSQDKKLTDEELFEQYCREREEREKDDRHDDDKDP